MPIKYNPIIKECPTCGRSFSLNTLQRYRLKKNAKSKSFCSDECCQKSKKGNGNPKWRGGRTICGEYIYIYSPNHPQKTLHGYVCEHRLVMEKHIGRFLLPEESIHHIDGNTKNNDISNLRLFSCEGEHRSLHAKYRTRVNSRMIGHKEGVTAYI